jgi:hypothetical protein
MVKFVINCMLNIQNFKHNINLFSMLNSTQYRSYSPDFGQVVGQRKGPSGANAPPVHGIKKCLVCSQIESSVASVEG